MFLIKIKEDKSFRQRFFINLSLIINILFSIFYVVFGITNRSYWFITAGAYFFILSITKILCIKNRLKTSVKNHFIIGILQILMCIPLIIMIILCHFFEVIKPLNNIVVIAIATHSFAKITIAIINVIKAKKDDDSKMFALRNINLSNCFVSILSLQRTMLVTFGKMETSTIKIMNLLTGIGVCLIIIFIGILTIKTDKKKR